MRHLQSQAQGLAGAAARLEAWGLSAGVRQVIGRRLFRLGIAALVIAARARRFLASCVF